MEKRYPKLFATYFGSYNVRLNAVLLSFFIFIGVSISSYAQEIVETFDSDGIFSVPEGVTSVKVECWGAGGKGSDYTGSQLIIDLLNPDDPNITVALGGTGGGGGGGAYSSSEVCVIPGETYTINVGRGGGTIAGVFNGGDTYFGNSSLVMAKGGKGLNTNWINGAAGGLASESIGEVKYNGGNGGNRVTYAIILALGYRSGGGGGGAGSSGVGKNAITVNPGGSTQDYGGAGGTGQDGALLSALSGFSGVAGNTYGGGGGGAGKGLLLSNPTYYGGNGASGFIRITYETYSCRASLSTTWNGSTWSNGAPEACKKAIIDGDYNTTTHGSFTACSCQVNAGKTLTIGTSNNIEVYNEITNNGGIVEVANDASLVQWYSTISNAGVIKVNRNTTPMYRYDFTYWSSPVTGMTMHDLSPATLSDKYYWWDANNQNWVVNQGGSLTMNAGQGYIIRAPQTFSTNQSESEVFSGIFEGAPHNGNITFPVVGDETGEKYNLIGNPYPSAISAEDFLEENSGVLEGTIHFWTHNSVPVYNEETETYQYQGADYISYNRTGGTAGPFGTPSEGYIASGQSFFVAGSTNGSVTFKNSMRKMTDNNAFYKVTLTTPINNWELVGKHRVWLNIKNTQGVSNQTLVGYIENATNGIDWGFDGETFNSNQVSLYSIVDNKTFSIQGRALPFSEQDVVQLGYTSAQNTTLKISIDHLDGLLNGKDIFLKDNVLNVYHNLKNSDYTFTSTAGTFNNRFQLVYENQTLSVGEEIINPESIIVFKDTQNSLLVNAGNKNIDEIKVYDLSGRLLYEKNKINTVEARLQNITTQHQVLIIEVALNEGAKVTKKIIF